MKLESKSEAEVVNHILVEVIGILEYGSFLKYAVSIKLALNDNDKDETIRLIKLFILEIRSEVNLKASSLYSKLNQKDRTIFTEEMTSIITNEILKEDDSNSMLGDQEIIDLLNVD